MRRRNTSWIGNHATDARDVSIITHYLLTRDTDKAAAHGVSAGYTVKQHAPDNITFVKPSSKIELHKGVVRAEIRKHGAVAQMETSRSTSASSLALSGNGVLAHALERAFHRLPRNVADAVVNQKRRIGDELAGPSLSGALDSAVHARSMHDFHRALERHVRNRHRRLHSQLRQMMSW